MEGCGSKAITEWREGLKIMVKIDKSPANQRPNRTLEHPEWGLRAQLDCREPNNINACIYTG